MSSIKEDRGNYHPMRYLHNYQKKSDIILLNYAIYQVDLINYYGSFNISLFFSQLFYCLDEKIVINYIYYIIN